MRNAGHLGGPHPSISTVSISQQSSTVHPLWARLCGLGDELWLEVSLETTGAPEHHQGWKRQRGRKGGNRHSAWLEWELSKYWVTLKQTEGWTDIWLGTKELKEAVGKTQTYRFWFLLIPWRQFAMYCPPKPTPRPTLFRWPQGKTCKQRASQPENLAHMSASHSLPTCLFLDVFLSHSAFLSRWVSFSLFLAVCVSFHCSLFSFLPSTPSPICLPNSPVKA